jgi:CubicO group peptidase (beta-lactamase class C family)
MIRHTFAAAALLATAPLAAQSTTQEEITARYDRALAAGYKAMFLCSALANTERAGTKRTEQSVLDWELSGIQAPLDEIAPTLEHSVYRFAGGEGAISHVSVEWAEDMPPRMAWQRQQGGCSIAPIGTTEPPEREYVPFSDSIYMWHDRIPQNRKLAAVIDRAFETGYGDKTRTTAVIVSQEGAVRLSRYTGEYSPVTPQRTWSVAKSLAATLVGAAVHRGEADVSQSAGLGETIEDPRRAITVDHALRMASGRYSDTPGNRTDPLYFGGATVDEVAVDWPLVSAPGTVYRYANNDTLAAVQAIEETFAAHPPADFLERVGMHHTVAETDWQGNYILSSQVWATAPDLLKLGQLYLDDGVLPDGTRVLPEGWAEYVATPSGPQPDGPFGYGAGFWLFNKTDGVPSDTYAAMGNRGQFIVIVPSMNVVIVRRGEDPAGQRFDIAAFTRDVLETLEK